MTDLPDTDLLYVALPAGRDRAEPLGSLAERLGWARRRVESAVMELRRSGAAVASDGHGVWVGDSADLEQTAASLRRRLVEQYVTLRAVRHTLRRMREAESAQQRLPWAS